MSHQVQKMFSVRERPWHYSLTGPEKTAILTEEDRPTDWPTARKLAGLDWDPIEETPYRKQISMDDKGNPIEEYVPVESHKWIARSDTGQVLGSAVDSYQLITNTDMGDIIEAMLGDRKMKFETGGCLDEGRKVWAMLQMGDLLEIPGDPSPTARYLALLNTHDGHGACKAIATNVRIVCHARGTVIQDGPWRGPVEQHHSVTEPRIGPGFRISVKGLPSTEDVTPEHRYWAKQRQFYAKPQSGGRPSVGENVPAQWVQAKNLIPGAHDIGLPIDTTEAPAPAIQVARSLGTSGPYGLTKLWSVERYELLDDPDWWWIIGYWLGDGNIHYSPRDGHPAGITLSIANGDTETLERVTKLFEKHGWNGKPHQRTGCVQVTHFDETLATLLDGWLQRDRDERGKGKSKKVPPLWVEQLPLNLQRELIKGLNAADGNTDTTHGAIISNTSYEMLLAARTILARLSIPASLRKARNGDPMTIQGRTVQTQPSYTLRFWQNTEQLGYTHRFKGKFTHPYIADGHIWSRVEKAEPIDEGEFWPITTHTEDYLTPFGRSHNCANTWHYADIQADADLTCFSFHHRSQWKQHLDQLREDVKAALSGASKEVAFYREMAEEFSRMKVTPAQEERFVDEFIFPTKNEHKLKPQSFKNVQKSRDDLRVILASPTCEGIRGTAYGLMQVGGEWADHVRRYKNEETYLNRTVFAAEELKARAKNLAELAGQGVL